MKTKFILRNKPNSKGTFPLVLRVTENRRSKIITLNFESNGKDWDSKKEEYKKSNPNYMSYNSALLLLKQKSQKIISDAISEGIEITLNQFEVKFRGKEPNRITVHDFFNEVIIDLEKSNKFGNARAIKETKDSLFNFIKNKNFTFKELTPALLYKYEVYLRENNNSNGGVAFKMREIRSVFNKAINRGVVDSKHYPFKVYKISKLKGENIKKALSIESIKKIIEFDTKSYPLLEEAKTIFIFSYYCSGMNFYDIILLKWENIKDERITYVRSKTKGKFSIKITEPVREILNKFKSLSLSSDYVFPILLENNITAKEINNIKIKKLRKFNKDLSKIASIVGINEKITSYVSRHSFATNLKQLGISTDIVSQSMGHKNPAITMAYLKEFENEEIDNAIEKLLFEDKINYSINNKRLAS